MLPSRTNINALSFNKPIQNNEAKAHISVAKKLKPVELRPKMMQMKEEYKIR